MSAEQAKLSFEVTKAFNFDPGVEVDGYFACPHRPDVYSLVSAVDGLGENADQGVLPVITSEYNYPNIHKILPRFIEQGVPINGVVTFGATGDVGSLRHGSHLTIICRSLEIPLCIARVPLGPDTGFDYRRSLYDSRISRLHGQAGHVALSKGRKKIKLWTE